MFHIYAPINKLKEEKADRFSRSAQLNQVLFALFLSFNDWVLGWDLGTHFLGLSHV